MYSTIVVGTDGSDSASAAVAAAADLARLTGGTVHLVSAYRAPSSGVAVPSAGVVAAATGGVREAFLERSCHDALDAAERIVGELPTARHAEKGEAADAIVAVAERVGADLIVVGSKGMRRRILGSVPNSVAHTAPCTVLIVKTA